MASDIEIAQKARLERISKIAFAKLGIPEEHLEPYGHFKAKVSLEYLDGLKARPNAKLVLVTAMTPTPAGEGKTTTTRACRAMRVSPRWFSRLCPSRALPGTMREISTPPAAALLPAQCGGSL